MNEKEIQPFNLSGASEDVVEPEIVDNGGTGRHCAQSVPRVIRAAGTDGFGFENARNASEKSKSPLIKLKLWFFYGLILGGIILIIPGLFLVSTIIGAVIGIPLILLGISAIWLGFKILLSGGKSGVFFYHIK